MFHRTCLFSTNMKIWMKKSKERGEYGRHVSTAVFQKKINTYLFSFPKIAHCSFGLGIVEVKSVTVVEVTLKNTDKPQINTTKKLLPR